MEPFAKPVGGRARGSLRTSVLWDESRKAPCRVEVVGDRAEGPLPVWGCRHCCISSFQEQLMKLQKQKQQATQQQAQSGGQQQAAQVQVQQQTQQLTAVAAPRPGAVLTGTTVTNLQVARLVSCCS